MRPMRLMLLLRRLLKKRLHQHQQVSRTLRLLTPSVAPVMARNVQVDVAVPLVGGVVRVIIIVEVQETLHSESTMRPMRVLPTPLGSWATFKKGP